MSGTVCSLPTAGHVYSVMSSPRKRPVVSAGRAAGRVAGVHHAQSHLLPQDAAVIRVAPLTHLGVVREEAKAIDTAAVVCSAAKLQQHGALGAGTEGIFP